LEKLKNSKLLVVIKWLWMGAVLTAVIYYIITNFPRVEDYFRTIHWLRFVMSFLLLLSAKLLIIEGSRISVKAEGISLPFWKFLSIFSLTALGKYLPGGMWHLLGRYGAYRSEKIDNNHSLRAMVAENIWINTSAFVGGVTALLLLNRGVLLANDINLTAMQAFLLTIPLVVTWVIGMLLTQRYVQSSHTLKPQSLLRVMAVYFPAWLLFSLSYGWLFPIVDLATLKLAVGAFPLSWFIGSVSIFAPAGIGVRELALTVFYAATEYASLALILASVHRVLWVLAELILGLATISVDTLKKKSGNHNI
jgi:glycosyltransferase 2 family protein